MAITLEQAKNLKPGTILYSMFNKNKKGEPQKWKVTSVKTWKTRPDDVLVKLQHGLYSYGNINHHDLDMVALDPDETL